MLDPILDRGFVANTDGDWFRHLRALARRTRARTGRGLEDVDFWIPSGRTFRAVPPGRWMVAAFGCAGIFGGASGVWGLGARPACAPW